MRMQTRMAVLFGAVVIATAFLMGALSYIAMASRLQAQVDTVPARGLGPAGPGSGIGPTSPRGE